MSPIDIIYDRQLRLIGNTTQLKLHDHTILIHGAVCHTTAEILKNIALLGVKEIITTPSIVKHTSAYIKVDVSELVRNSKIIILEEEEIHSKYYNNSNIYNNILYRTILYIYYLFINKYNTNKYNRNNTNSNIFIFYINNTYNINNNNTYNINNNNNYIYLCMSCMLLKYKNIKCKCNTNILSSSNNVNITYSSNGCLRMTEEICLGAIAVQEFIKVIEGKEPIEEYTI